MKCIVGLGNPGNRYRFTRHNIGFLAIEFLIDKFKAKHFEGNSLYECYQTTLAENSVLFVMPQTYMNNSGTAVREIFQKYDLAFADFLILYDDFQIPFGTLRLRPKGSDGGHNGLSSIIYHLENDLVPRLRIGVSGKTMPIEHNRDSMADYVLSRFDADEEKLLPQLLNYTCNASISWVQSGIQETMNHYNRNFFTSANAE
ncbi:MAG TPA: aminoacyl-tRNA hydrolase [Bacteroidetes bacterium]|nr:aminoacyl-tRNA hydrolase [Bacteroidota bacterium]